jgi:ribosomal protein L37E
MTSHEEAGDMPENCVAVAVPHWFLLSLLAVAPTGSLALILGKSRRLHEMLCRRCGYDLRASADRCPECGQPVARHVPGAMSH